MGGGGRRGRYPGVYRVTFSLSLSILCLRIQSHLLSLVCKIPYPIKQ